MAVEKLYRVTISHTFEIGAKDDVVAILKARRYLSEGARDNESIDVRERYRVTDPPPMAPFPVRR